jgi:hypothetical protein
VRLQLRVQVVQHHAGLHRGGALLGVEVTARAQVLAVVDHQRRAGGLAALAGAAAARQHGTPARGDVQRGGHVGSGVRGTNTPTGMIW